MAKYRIVKHEYPNGKIDYEVQKKILGLFWWNFENVYGSTTGFYDTLGEAKTAIKMHKEKPKKTVINIK